MSGQMFEVSSRSENGTPSRKGRVVNDHMTQGKQTTEYTPPSPTCIAICAVLNDSKVYENSTTSLQLKRWLTFHLFQKWPNVRHRPYI